MSAAVSTARPGSTFISPSWRTMGGEPTDMWRSEAFISMRVRNSSSISAVGPDPEGRRGAMAGAAAAGAMATDAEAATVPAP